MRKALFGILAILFATSVWATSPEVAKQNVKKFIEYAKKHGKQAALAEVRPDGKFGTKALGEAYIFIFDKNKPCVLVAHGANPKLAGKDLKNIKDLKGKYFAMEFYEVAKKGGGFVTYYWPNPVTKKVQPKVSYAEAYDGWIVGAGVYK